MINNLFLDLDETLWHSIYCNDMKGFVSISDEFPQESYPELERRFVSDGIISFLRPWAPLFLKWAEEAFTPERVFLLTTAMRDYAVDALTQFNLSRFISRMFARDDLWSAIEPHPQFVGQNNILVDNLHFFEHLRGQWMSKTTFASVAEENYIRVPEFNIYLYSRNPNAESNRRDFVINEIKQKIK
jgi:hypothetical protein